MVHFLEESDDTKCHFKIIWHLEGRNPHKRFVGCLVDLVTPKGHFEINWPLVWDIMISQNLEGPWPPSPPRLLTSKQGPTASLLCSNVVHTSQNANTRKILFCIVVFFCIFSKALHNGRFRFFLIWFRWEKDFWYPRILPKNESTNSFLLLRRICTFVFWDNEFVHLISIFQH